MWVRRSGLAFRQHPRRLPDPPRFRDAAWLRRQHHERGRSLTDIARELGRARSTVRRRFRVYGIPIRHQRTYPQLRDAEWLDAQFTAGKSSRTIAREIGCSEATVRLSALRGGVVPRAHRDHRHPVRRTQRIRQALEGLPESFGEVRAALIELTRTVR